jgi:hypothetical protein
MQRWCARRRSSHRGVPPRRRGGVERSDAREIGISFRGMLRCIRESRALERRSCAARSAVTRHRRRCCASAHASRVGSASRACARRRARGGNPASCGRASHSHRQRPPRGDRSRCGYGYAGEEMPRQAPDAVDSIVPRHAHGLRAAALVLPVTVSGVYAGSPPRRWRHRRGGKYGSRAVRRPRSSVRRVSCDEQQEGTASVTRYGCRRGKAFGGCCAGGDSPLRPTRLLGGETSRGR